MTENKCHCCLWRFNNCTRDQDQRSCEWKVTEHCVSFPVCFCVECSATVQVYRWKMCTCVWAPFTVLLPKGICLLQTSNPAILSVHEKVCFYSPYHPSWSQTNCHSDGGQLALTRPSHTQKRRHAHTNTHGLTRQITDWSWSYTNVNHRESRTFRVNLKSAPGSLCVVEYM